MGFPTDDPTDPFLPFLQPPENETPAQTTARLKRESDAQRISDEIDEEIRQHRVLTKRDSALVKVLLLGQAESGKSTTLKNFRMRYDADAWERERNGWKAVVQLNLVRSIITILSVIEAEFSRDIPGDLVSDEESLSNEAMKFTDLHQLLMIRLAPLRGLEAELKIWLDASAEPLATSLPMTATPLETPTYDSSTKRARSEFAVRSWHDVVNPAARSSGQQDSGFESTTATLAEYKSDMKALWEDSLVQRALARRKLRLPDSAGFFLNELDRIATRDYRVTDDDIVRARLRTVGIQEYRLRFSNTPLTVPRIDGAWEWRIFDVGGSRTMRAAWLPFFENTNAVIFLCPVSCFDERLEEDPRVNRLEDSTVLWRSICTSKLLAKTQLLCFLNKCDLLKRKLKQGVMVKDFLISYGDRPNEVMTFVKYLREKFKEILKQYSPVIRSATYIYPTTVTDTQATAKTLESVHDGILRENLTRAQLM